MDEHGRTWKNGIWEDRGKDVTNMDEHGRTVSEGGGGGLTNMDECERTWTNLVEHCKTIGPVCRYQPIRGVTPDIHLERYSTIYHVV